MKIIGNLMKCFKYGLAMLMLFLSLHANAQWQVTATGSANNFTLPTYPANLTSYTPGLSITFKSNQTITGPATLSINGLSAIAIKKQVTVDLAANDILSGQFVTVIYDQANGVFQLVSALGSSSSSISGSGTINYIPRWNSGSALGNSQLYDAGVSGVGMGTITPSGELHIFKNNGPRIVLDGDGGNSSATTQLDFTTGGNSSATSNVGNVTGWQFRSFSSSFATTPRQNDFMLRFYNGTSFTDAIYFDNSGKVGMGTLAPSERLHVAGRLRVDSAFMPNNLPGTAGQVLTSQGAFSAPIWTNAPATITASNGLTKTVNDIKLGGSLTQATTINQNAFNLMFTGTGNIGIGTTTPGEKLDVAGNLLVTGLGNGATSGITVKGTDGTSGPGLEINNGTQSWRWLATGNNLILNKLSGTTFTPITIKNNSFNDALVIGDAGVGIGYSAPEYIMDVRTAADALVNVSSSAASMGTKAGLRLSMFNGYIGKQYTIAAEKSDATGNSGASDLVIRSHYSTAGGTMNNVVVRGEDVIFNESKTTSNPFGNVLVPNGNLGVGALTASEKLDVDGNFKLSGSFMPSGSAGTTGYLLSSNGAGAAPSWVDPSSSGPWSRAGSKMYPTNFTDSIGIGNNNPYAKFLVHGNSNSPTLPSISQSARSLGTQRLSFTSGDVFDIGFQASPMYAAWMQSGYSGSAEAILINPLGGNVGIGTNNPNYKLDVAGDINFNTALRINGNAGPSGFLLTSNGGGSMIWTDPSTLSGSWVLNGTDLYNSNSGNVGIGNPSPNRKLDIEAGTSELGIIVRSTGNNPEISILNNAAGGRRYSMHSTGGGSGWGQGKFVLADATAGAVRLAIDNTGKVGIGTVSPTEMLEVIGKTKTINLQVTTGPVAGNVLTSDASGNATWQYPNRFSFLVPSNIGSINVTSGTSTNFPVAAGSFTKSVANTAIRLTYHGHVNISGNTNAIRVEMRIDGNLTSYGYCSSDVFNNGNILITIDGIFKNISVGSHTVSFSAYGVGSGATITVNSGNYQEQIIIQEFYSN